jgi:hypothetical protein
MQISRGKLDRLRRTPAESTALALMDTGLRRYGPARPTRDASYSVSVRQVATLLPRFFQTAPRGHRPCASLALRLHQTLGRGLSPPSCQTCSAHPSLWTQRPRPQVTWKTAKTAVFHSAHTDYFFSGNKKKSEERTTKQKLQVCQSDCLSGGVHPTSLCLKLCPNSGECRSSGTQREPSSK